MRKGLTGTKHFGLDEMRLSVALRQIASGELSSFSGKRARKPVQTVGTGVTKLEALGAWMRFGGLVTRSRDGVQLSALGRCLYQWDGELSDDATWWVLHWQLANNYLVWRVLSRLPQGRHEVSHIEQALQQLSPEASVSTIKNARLALMAALAGEPIREKLGLVELEYKGKRVSGLRKLAVRHGQAPMAAVAYALLDWARREETGSAALETLAGPDGPGAVLHMSPGVLERYLVDIDGAFGGRVLSYSRTAGLSEAYFKPEVTPLQVLVSHYIQKRDGCPWPEALDRAKQEVGSEDATD